MIAKVSNKLVCRRGMGRATAGIRSFMVVARGTSNGARDMVIKDQADVLKESGNEIGGGDLGIKANNAVCARSIKGSNILDISSRSSNRNNKVRRSTRGTNTSGISYYLRSIETMLGWGEPKDL